MHKGVVAVGLVAVVGGVGFLAWQTLGSPASSEVKTDDEAAAPGTAEAAENASLKGAAKKPEAVKPVETPFKVRGIVHDEAGAPAAGVRVTAKRSGPVWDQSDPSTWGQSSQKEWFEKSLANIDAPKSQEEKPDGEATTGADGKFEIPLRESGWYSVRARPEPPKIGTSGQAGVTVRDPEREVVLTLLAGSRVRGRVIDLQGKGVSAVVSAAWETKESPNGWSGGPIPTDPASGEFAFPAVPAGRGTLAVVLPGRCELHGIEVTTPTDEVVTIKVGEGGVVRGRIADAAGQPVASADVTVFTGTAGSSGTTAPGSGTFRAKAGADGTYRMEGVVPGRVTQATAFAAGYTLLSQSPPRAPWSGAEVKVGAETVVDLVLSKGATIEGRVLLEKTGEPVADAEVFVMPVYTGGNWYGMPPPTPVDAQGRFRAEGLALGKYVLLPRSPTCYFPPVDSISRSGMSWDGENMPSAPPQVTVVLSKEGETAERTLSMRKGLTVVGKVVGPEGAPVEGATVRAAGAGAPNLWMWGIQYGVPDRPLATSRADGTFEAAGVAPRDDATLVAAKGEFVGQPCEPFAVKAGPAPPSVTLKLALGASISGKVVDGAGKGVAGANIWFWSQENSGYVGGNNNVTSGADGAFTMKGLPGGRGTLGANTNRGGWKQTVLDPPLTLGEKRTGLEIKLELGTASVSGVVVDSEGKGVAGKQVQANSQKGGGGGSATTKADGTFLIEGVPEGDVQVYVMEMVQEGNYWGQSSGSAATSVKAPATGVRLVWTQPKTTQVFGRVLDPDGKPVPLCTVKVKSGAAGGNEGQRYWGGSDPDEVVGGEFRRAPTGDAPFSVTVRNARDDHGQPLNLKTKTVNVTDASTAVVVTLESGGEVTGTVLDPEGLGVEGVRLKAGGVATATTDADGKFRLGGFEKDDVEITVQPPPRYTPPAPVKARVGQKDLVVRLTTGAAITGTLLGPDGKPWTRGNVNAQWRVPGTARAGNVNAMAGADGKFRLEGLPDDAVAEVNVWPGDDGTGVSVRGAKAKDVRAGTQDLVLRLETAVSIEGTVVNANGDPATISWIEVHRVEGDDQNMGMNVSVNEGTFSVRGLTPGNYTLLPHGNGGQALGEAVKASAPSKGVRIVVPASATIRGRIEGGGDDRQKFAVALWLVSESGPGRGWGQVGATVAADGSFTAEASADVDYYVKASKGDDDRYAFAGPVRAGAGEVVLRVETGAPIEGVLEDAAGAAQPKGYVMLRGDKWPAMSTRTDDAGKFKFRGLPPGRYTLSAWSGKYVEVGQADAGDRDVHARMPPK